MAYQEVVSPERARKKRARTGCLRCRTRRRKCDEHKPRCQRCLDADAECVYGPRLSFLQKNAITLSNRENDPSIGKSSDYPKYSKVQFVDDESTRQKDVDLNEDPQALHPSSLSIEGESSVAHDGSPPKSLPETTTPSTPIESQSSLFLEFDSPYYENSRNIAKPLDSQGQNNVPSHHHEDNKDHNMEMRQGGSYEIALDVLMTLGTGDPGVDIPAPVSPVVEVFEEANASPPPSILKTIGDLGPVSPHVANQLSLGRSIELLRHYRYKIAPWLDICDMKQTFGLVVPHLAMRSNMLFDALLKLCTTSYEVNHSRMGSISSPIIGRSSHLIYPIEHHLEQSKMWEVKLWSILTATERFLTDPPRSWEDGLAKNSFLHMIYVPIPESSPLQALNECMLWLLARLSVAAALLKGASSFVSSSLLRSSLRSSSQRGVESGHAEFLYAHKALVLCTEVLEFSFGDENLASSPGTEPPRPRAVRWKSIIDELNDWYTNRPPTFRPVIELDSEESPFPIMYFTSGTAIFANQLYHTAMMLVLAHKPRTAQFDQRRTSSLSQLWHARRICSIAINNNRCECWDPCLLASFYLAARRMTHESQQREILLGFKHISTLGWLVGSFVERLNQEWNASEPLALG